MSNIEFQKRKGFLVITLRFYVVALIVCSSFVVGFFAALGLVAPLESGRNMPKQLIADCAVGQDHALRETTGTATYRVTFQDGAYVDVDCVSEQNETE